MKLTKSYLKSLIKECISEQSGNQEYNYMMMDRLKQDCEYYLGYGHKNKRHLYYKDEKKHIEEMKKLYKQLPKKPQWLTYQQILDYEKLMCDKNNPSLTEQSNKRI